MPKWHQIVFIMNTRPDEIADWDVTRLEESAIADFRGGGVRSFSVMFRRAPELSIHKLVDKFGCRFWGRALEQAEKKIDFSNLGPKTSIFEDKSRSSTSRVICLKNLKPNL